MGSSMHLAVVGVDGSPASPASQAAQAWATDVVDEVHAVHIGEGRVADELERIADERGADLIVVGMHDQRRRVLRTLGPVVGTLLRRARRPVVVVGEQSRADGSVVVGVGRSAATERAVRWSAAVAADQGARLELVRAVPHRPVFRPDGLLDVLAFYVDPAMAAEWAAQDIESFVNEVDRATDGEVVVDWSAPPGRPGPALVEAGGRARLLVIGIHDRSDSDGDGNDVPNWCRHVLLHAPCPVVFVPG